MSRIHVEGKFLDDLIPLNISTQHKVVLCLFIVSCLAMQSEECLKKEKERVAHYLHASSEEKLLEVCFYSFMVVVEEFVSRCAKALNFVGSIFIGCVLSINYRKKLLVLCIS